MFIMAFRGII